MVLQIKEQNQKVTIFPLELWSPLVKKGRNQLLNI
jgi:hypothetical protein